MLRGSINAPGRDAEIDPAEATPAQLRTAYEAQLAATVRDHGREHVEDATDVDTQTLASLLDGESPVLTITDAATILAVDPARPDAGTLANEARDLLVASLAAAVVDVRELSEQIAVDSSRSLTPAQIRAKLEGAEPLTLESHAAMYSYAAARR